MDMSKLPKLSNTPPPAPPATPVPEAQVPEAIPAEVPPPVRASYNADPTTVAAPEIWISAILGIIFMYFGKVFGSYLIARLTGQPFHTGVDWVEGPKAGTEVAYFELTGFTALTDAGVFLFGLTMVVEALAMLAIVRVGRRGAPVLAAAFCVAIGMTLFNLFVAAKLLSSNGPTPIMSILAVGFGGYIAMYQWQWLKSLRAKAT